MKKTLFILLVIAIGSCQDIENCDTNDEWNFMIVDFLDRETQTPVKIGFTITASGSPFQFVPFEDSTGIGLPLDPNSETVTFSFDSLGTSVSYSLEVSYDTQVSIFDEDCEPSFTFMNLDTVSYSFDSLSIPGRITNRQVDSNVQVFF